MAKKQNHSSEESIGSISMALNEYKADQSSLAAYKLVDRLRDRIEAIMRNKANEAVRNDVCEIVQQAFVRLFSGLADGSFNHVKNRDHLWNLLLQMSRFEMKDATKARLRQKRGGGKVLDRQAIVKRDDDGNELSFAQFAELGASEVGLDALSSELYEQVMSFFSELEAGPLRDIALAKADGSKSTEEIAADLGVSRETVRRKWNRVKKLAHKRFGSI